MDTEIDDGFGQVASFALFQEYSNDEGKGDGGFKTRTELGTLLYASDRESSLNYSVERLLAVDGWEDETKTQRVTLLVLHCEVASTESDCSVSAVKTWIDLEDSPASAKHNTVSSPEIQAWGPFTQSTAWNRSEENVTREGGGGGSLGAGASGATAQLDAEYKKTREKKERFFDRGDTVKRYSEADDRLNGILWSVRHNRARKEGVPSFQFAILFNRKNDDTFDLDFGLRCYAGGAWETVKRWFGQGDNIRKQFRYTPHPDTPRKTRQTGTELLALVNPQKLGALYGSDENGVANLEKLTHIAALRFVKFDQEGE